MSLIQNSFSKILYLQMLQPRLAWRVFLFFFCLIKKRTKKNQGRPERSAQPAFPRAILWYFSLLQL